MPTRFYHITPELRRSAAYGMVGFAFLAVAGYVIAYHLLERELLGTISFLRCFLPYPWPRRFPYSGRSASMTSASRDAVRSTGTCGPGATWRAAESQSWAASRSTIPADRGGGDIFSSIYLAEMDRKELLQRINEHYRLPEPPALPESLCITAGFRRKIEFRHSEIRVTIGREVRAYLWSKVHRLRISRVERECHTWVRLILWLPGCEIALGNGKEHPFSGATREELNAFLLQYVPADRVDEDIWGECPHRVEDVTRELDKINARERQVRYCMWLGGVTVAIFLVTTAIARDVMKMAIVGGLFISMELLMCAIWWDIRRIHREQRLQMQSWISNIRARRSRV
jgi:hypothetical protein